MSVAFVSSVVAVTAGTKTSVQALRRTSFCHEAAVLSSSQRSVWWSSSSPSLFQFHSRSKSLRLRHGASLHHSSGARPHRNVPTASLRDRLAVLVAALPLFLLPASSFAAPSSPPPSSSSSAPTSVQSTRQSHSSTLHSGVRHSHTKANSPAVLVASASVAERSSSALPSSTNLSEREPGGSSSQFRTRRSAGLSASLHRRFRVGFGRRFSFYLSEFLMWHPSAKVVALFSFTLLAMFLGSFLYRIADPKREEAQYPFWHAVRAIANPLEDDWQKNSLRATSITLAAFGMVVFAILVGMVTETVESIVRNADGENTRVLVSDHIVVCDWGPHVAQIIKDVNDVTSDVKVVVLAAPDKKQALMDDIRSLLPDDAQKNMRIYYRPGAPTVPQDLLRVNASQARKIILVSGREGDPVDRDRIILSRALALRQNLPAFRGDIVAELSSTRDESLVQAILGRSKARTVETINTEQLLFRFMAQAIRQPGLADIVSLLMGDNQMSVFHITSAKEAAPQLVGTNFSDMRPTSVPGAILCGFVDSNGVHMQTAPKYGGLETIKPDTEMLLLGATKAMRSIVMPANQGPLELSPSMAGMMQRFIQNHSRAKRGHPERFLVLGWRKDMESMLQELDNVLPRGSSVRIVDQDVPDKLYLSLRHLKVELVKKRADRYENIESLVTGRSRPYDHVVVIGASVGRDSDNGMETSRNDDARTLATLVYVNDVLAKQRTERNMSRDKQPLVTVEFLREDVARMIKEQSDIANAILPQNLGSKITAQTVRDSRLNAVWRELLSQEGREVYLRPVSAYKGFAKTRSSFATLADQLAKSSDDILIGFIPSYIPKVKINPQGPERFTAREWNENDILIVLSNE